MTGDTERADRLPPHPVLARYYRSPEERRAAVQAMFDASARHYDWIIRMMSFGSGDWYRRQALVRAGVGAGQSVVDVGCGTGSVALLAQELVGPQGEVVAVDPSAGMLEVARENGVRWPVRARGEALPLADGRFDHLNMGYALRHVDDLIATMREYLRVLRPGGRVLLLEITRPPGGLLYACTRFYLKHVVPLLTRLLRGSRQAQQLMEYYWDTIENCVPPDRILDAMRAAGFEQVERHVVMGIFSEYRGRRPS